jgi:hypothetical protein
MVDKSTVVTESVAPTGSDVLQRCATLIVLIAGVMPFGASTVGAAESSGGLPPTDAAYRGLYAVTATVLAATPAPDRDAGRNTGVASATASMSCDDAMRAHVNQLLGPYGVPVPVLTRVAVTRTGAAADYLAGEIQFRRCLHDTELAHEVAHHVVDWTAGSWAGVVATARGFCPGLDDRGACSHSWLSSRLVEFEASIGAPGVEHIAHCVGWVLVGTGTFTRCDNDVFRDAAVDLLSAAG